MRTFTIHNADNGREVCSAMQEDKDAALRLAIDIAKGARPQRKTDLLIRDALGALHAVVIMIGPEAVAIEPRDYHGEEDK